jgi:hypothetical protein
MSQKSRASLPSSPWPIRRGGLAALILCAACAAGTGPGPRPPTEVFDLSAGCSPERNPYGVWQYGYTIEQALVPSAFRRDRFYDSKSSIGFWQPSSIPHAGHYPYVACNRSARTEYGPCSIPGTRHGWAARAGQVAMEASNSGQYSVVRFTAPVTGNYRVTARFEAIHFGLSTTDVHVMHGAKSLFAAEIEGYGGDPTFHAVSGAAPAAAYAGTVKLEARDTIDFAVGYGKNRTHFADTTGLFARLELVTTDLTRSL